MTRENIDFFGQMILKMNPKYSAFTFLLVFNVVNSAVLFWGPKQVQIPALKQFDNNDFKNLLSKIHNPQVIAFRSKSINVAASINKFVTNRTTSYVPNTKLSIDNIQELTDDEETDLTIIREALKQIKYKKGSNTVVALIIKNERVKRKAEASSTTAASTVTATTTEALQGAYSEPPTGPILYSATSPTDKNIEAMIYSSKPPLLKANGSSINLGESTLSNMDIREQYTRLIATIPVESGKVILRFKFPWSGGYWYLSSVEVEFVDIQSKKYDLTLNQDVTAPRRFSYHCGGEVIFNNTENDIELRLFEVQAQPDADSHRFNDAYNCVPFTTGPIWSGIFVTFVLAIGLAVGLSALGSIKTMDKFDNYKTKQLSITVWE